MRGAMAATVWWAMMLASPGCGETREGEPAPAPPIAPSSPAPPPGPAPTPTHPAPAPPAEQQPGIPEADIPPSLRLGLRAAMVRARLPVIRTVVLVPDERSYIAAIGAWNFEAGVRFPVLIDDGSWPARQAAARFVRAFAPASVVRWTAPDSFAWPDDPAARRAIVERAAAQVWLKQPLADAASPAEALRERWREVKFTPPGLVIADIGDPAWLGAAALAAGRGQPIAWLTSPAAGTPAGYMDVRDAISLAGRVEQAAEATGWTWSELGDDLDAVTIALNCATKVYLGDKDQRAMLSLSDWVGRHPENGGDKQGQPGTRRWAWCGQLIGSGWQSAYAAMCSLYLTTDRAWLFDGYESTPPWNRFDMTDAAGHFERLGIATMVDDDAGRSITTWRRRGSLGGLDAGIVCVNSSGNADFFDLKPGQGKPADVPILRRPAMVHFVHSWSAQAPSDPATVAGAWLQRGAYAYVGSVHEPYLQAFVPTPKFAQRMAAGLPISAAARLDDGEPWKVSILGDPLAMLGKIGPASPAALPLEGAASVQDDLTDAVRKRDFTRALNNLLLLGRDADGAELLGGVLRESRENLAAEGALAGLASAFLAKDLGSFIGAYEIAQPRLAGEEMIRRDGLDDARDMLWHALWPDLGSLDRQKAQMLSLNLRAATLVRDAGEAYSAVSRAVNPGAARDVLARATRQATGEQRKQIEQIGR